MYNHILSILQSGDSYVFPACGTGDFSFDRISISTVLSHLSTLDVSKSAGSDGLSAAFLKEVTNEIAIPLTNLYIGLRLSLCLKCYLLFFPELTKNFAHYSFDHYHKILLTSYVACR